MTWSYRIMKHEEDSGEVWYGIHEVYQYKDGLSYTVKPVDIFSENINGIIWQIEAMLKDIKKYEPMDYESKT